ncbi:MAG: hypothetical protein ACLFP4_03610 [Spirochaetales bacterium]
MRRSLFAAAAAALLAIGCATSPPTFRQDDISSVVEAFNNASVPAVAEHVRLPFLVEDQPVYSEADFTAVLERLRESGLVLDVPSLELRSVPAAPAGARFALGVYYDELPENAQAAVMNSTVGTVTILVGGNDEGRPQLLGIYRGTR